MHQYNGKSCSHENIYEGYMYIHDIIHNKIQKAKLCVYYHGNYFLNAPMWINIEDKIPKNNYFVKLVRYWEFLLQ